MEENSRLDLNTESIHQRTGISSSLTDINQIFVFTDEFQNIKNKVNSKEQLKKELLEAQIFEQQMAIEAEDDIIANLFITEEEKTVVRDGQMAADENPIYLLGSLLLILFALALSTTVWFKKKEKKSNDVDNQLQRAG